MRIEEVARETQGVTVKLLATVGLGPEIEGMAGRHLRMRMVTIDPGGVFGPVHSHEDRPGIVDNTWLNVLAQRATCSASGARAVASAQNRGRPRSSELPHDPPCSLRP
jgi:hypothetical protein